MNSELGALQERFARLSPNAGSVPLSALRPGEGVSLIEASSLKPEPIRWLWNGWLARGKLHVLAGAPGTGKTTLAMHLAACISAGRPFPDGSTPQAGGVLIWSGEDDPRDTLVPRLQAAGADRDNIRFVGDVIEDGKRYPFDPAKDVDRLKAALICNVSLIVIDPLVSAISGDSHKNAEVRRGMAPLVDLAQRLDAALLGITHYSKGTQGREPLERVSGSLAFGAMARIVMGTIRQQSEADNTRSMTLARAKSNIGPDGGGFSYEFEQTELEGGISANRIQWGAVVDGSARELLAEPETHGDLNATDEAEQWLVYKLKDGPGKASDIQKRARLDGISDKPLRRARERLGIKPRKSDFHGGWIWELPPKMPQSVQVAHPEREASSASSQDEGIFEGEL